MLRQGPAAEKAGGPLGLGKIMMRGRMQIRCHGRWGVERSEWWVGMVDGE